MQTDFDEIVEEKTTWQYESLNELEWFEVWYLVESAYQSAAAEGDDYMANKLCDMLNKIGPEAIHVIERLRKGEPI